MERGSEGRERGLRLYLEVLPDEAQSGAPLLMVSQPANSLGKNPPDRGSSVAKSC